jgi:hypothetical protein
MNVQETCGKRLADRVTKFVGLDNDLLALVHVEVNTPDPEKAKASHSKLFQSQLENVPNPAVVGGSVGGALGVLMATRGLGAAGVGPFIVAGPIMGKLAGLRAGSATCH